MAKKTGAWSQDILTRIYNVQWGGLAVEFGDKDQAPPNNSDNQNNPKRTR